jgi:hypothetical protein
MFSALGDGRAEASLIASSRYKDFPREPNSVKEKNETLVRQKCDTQLLPGQWPIATSCGF